jgi:Uma2 family endonuclease
MNVPVKPARHSFTGEDILRMQEAGLLLEGGKFELIEGEIIDMPSEGRGHLGLRAVLTRFLARNLPDDVAIVPDGTLRLGDRDWPEPDFYLHPDAMEPADVRGPDVLLAIEISDSTLAHDLRRKAELYRSFGIREYWVIDVNALQVHVHRQPGGWPAPPLTFATTLEPMLIPGFRICIAELWPRTRQS